MWLLSAALVPLLAKLVSLDSPGERLVDSPALQWLLACSSLAFAAQHAAIACGARTFTKSVAAATSGSLACAYIVASAGGVSLPDVGVGCVCAAAALALHFGGAAWAALGIGAQERLILTQALVLSCWALVSTCYDVFVLQRLPTDEAEQVQTAVSLLLGGCGALTACAVPLLAFRDRKHRAQQHTDAASGPHTLLAAARAAAASGPGISPTAAPSPAPPAAACKQTGEAPAAGGTAAALFYTAALVIIAGVEYPTLQAALGGREPVSWVLGDLVAGSGGQAWGRARLLLFLWWGACLSIAAAVSVTATGSAALAGAWGTFSTQVLRLPAVRLPASATLLLVRKAFHALAVALFLPALLAPPAPGAPLASLLALGLAVAFKLLLCAELARALGLPPGHLWGPQGIGGYMRRFTDARDDAASGTFILTHLYLAAGCAVPLWTALPRLTRPAAPGGSDLGGTLTAVAAAAAGIAALGLGDAAAAAVGVTMSSAGRAQAWGTLLLRPGKRGGKAQVQEPRPAWASKTLEGSLAFIVAGAGGTCAALIVVAAGLAVGGAPAAGTASALATACTVAVAALTAGSAVETFSDCIDNVVVPLSTLAAYLLCMRLLPGNAAAAAAA